jgi:tetratricopeptide (TPR) repeat protein
VDIATKRNSAKQQDQFIATTQNSLSWASQNRSTAIGAAIALVVLIAVLVGGYTFYAHRVSQASTAFGEAMQTYQTPIATPGQQIPPGTKTFPDQKSRATAANALFVAVAGKYGMTEPGKLAKYFAGVTYSEEGQNGSAESTLKEVASSWNGDIAALAKQALAQLYQQTGRDSDAIALYNELAKKDSTTVPAGSAKLQLAALYESEGKTVDANKIYAELKDKDKDSKGQPGPAGAIAASKLEAKK